MYKFTGDKYVTKGINERLPAVIVIYLMQLIEERKKSNLPMDYLQIFELESNGDSTLSIIHKQEEPEYVRGYVIKNDLKIKDKIYVIDDVEYITVMFASEY